MIRKDEDGEYQREDLTVEDVKSDGWQYLKWRKKTQITFCMATIAWVIVGEMASTYWGEMLCEIPMIFAAAFVLSDAQDELRSLELVEQQILNESEEGDQC